MSNLPNLDSPETACGVGALAGVAASLVTLGLINTSYSRAKSSLSSLPAAADLDVQEESKSTAKRQHVVFLLGPPFTNRRVIAKRLTVNRHLAKANGGPVVIEFDDCIEEAMRDKIISGVVLSENEVDVMIDQAIKHVQKAADARPVIFSAVLPFKRWRRRFLLAFSERTVIRLTAPADELVNRFDMRSTSHSDAETPPASPTETMPRKTMPVARSMADSTRAPISANTADLLSLEAVAMVQCMAEQKLRNSKSYVDLQDAVKQSLDEDAEMASGLRQHARVEASVRWLHGSYEEIEMPHAVVDAARTLHQVAKEVRQIVVSKMLRCSARSRRVDEDVAQRPIRRVGGKRTVLGICCVGGLAGSLIGLVVFRWQHHGE